MLGWSSLVRRRGCRGELQCHKVAISFGQVEKLVGGQGTQVTQVSFGKQIETGDCQLLTSAIKNPGGE